MFGLIYVCFIILFFFDYYYCYVFL